MEPVDAAVSSRNGGDDFSSSWGSDRRAETGDMEETCEVFDSSKER
jgi:hypothetical protein